MKPIEVRTSAGSGRRPRRLGSALALCLIAPTLSACAAPFALSAHTLWEGDRDQQDVVWLKKGSDVYRCTAPEGRPVCQRVALP